MRYLSVCSGIEAASVAWHPLGWKPAAFSEIEPFPSAVLAHHYPDTPNLGDMTQYATWPRSLCPDLLVGGTPCQSFSVAGLRKGLDDPRGNLMLTFGAIAARYRPRWLVWENVPGVLSSGGGRDFASFLGLITGQRVEPPAEGWANAGVLSGIASAYGVAWRVLDAQFTRVESHPYAVPQRRRRVFVVGHLGDWRRAAAVLLERESLRGDSAPRRQAGKGTAQGVEIGPSGGSFADVNPTLETRAKDGPMRNQLAGAVLCADLAPIGFRMQAFGQYEQDGTASAMKQRDAKDATDLIIAFPERMSATQCASAENLSPALGAKNPTAVAIPIDLRSTSRGEKMTNNRDPEKCSGGAAGTGVGKDGDAAFTVSERQQAVAFEPRYYTRDNKTGGAPSDVAVLKADACKAGDSAPHVAICGAVSHSLRGEGMDASEDGTGRGTPIDAVPDAVQVQWASGGGEVENPTAQALRAGAEHNYQFARIGMSVRRLTPRECERLQGFPDDYTLVPHRGKPACDGPRYKALGNSMAVNVMRWIGERIQIADTL